MIRLSSRLCLLLSFALLTSTTHAGPATIDVRNTTATTSRNNYTITSSQNITLTAGANFESLVEHQLDSIRLTKIKNPQLRWIQCISTDPNRQDLSLLTDIYMDVIDPDSQPTPNSIYSYGKINTDWLAPPELSTEQALKGFKPWLWEANPSDLYAEMMDLVLEKIYGPWHWFMMLNPLWTIDHWAAGKVWFIFVRKDDIGKAYAIKRGGGMVYEVRVPDMMYPIDAAKDLLEDLPAKPGWIGQEGGGGGGRQLQEID